MKPSTFLYDPIATVDSRNSRKPYALYLVLLLAASAVIAQPVPSIRPASGFTTGGDLVHLRTGGGLRGRSPACPGASCPNYVKFGDAFGRIIANTPEEIVVIAPPHAAGAVDVTVGIPGVFSPIILANAYWYQTVGNSESERILIPVAASGPGANSARFETEISVTNVGDAEVGVWGAAATPSLASPPPIPILPAHTTGRFTDSLRTITGHAGAFVYVAASVYRDVITKVRVHDTSRDATAPGIPTDPRFRATLRVYAFDATNFGPVTLRVRDDADGTLLVTVPVALDRVPAGLETDFPASVQLSLDPIIEPLRSHARLRIDIVDSDTIRPIWGFVSVTNNQSQEITLVTPHPSGTAATPDKLPLGWYTDGGRFINVGETESSLYFLCNVGSFKTPSSLDANGHFTTTGVLTRGPGPVPIGGGISLNFEGRVADGWLTLTVHPAVGIFTDYHLQFFGAVPPTPPPVQCP